jgi:hypothetical protein
VTQHIPHELIAKKVRKALDAKKTIVYGSKNNPQIMIGRRSLHQSCKLRSWPRSWKVS